MNEFNVTSYGAMGDGSTDDRAAIQSAMAAAAAAGGGIVYFPAGTYTVKWHNWPSTPPSQPYTLDVPGSNIHLVGEKGLSWIKHPSGMPNIPVGMLRVNNRQSVTIEGLGFDGNWGATVGATDTIPQWTPSTTYSVGQKVRTIISSVTRCFVCITSGTSSGVGSGPATSDADVIDGTVHWQYIGAGSVDNNNHQMQTDPRNYGVVIRGGTNITVRDCAFRDTYGDAIWVGSCADTSALYREGATDVKILGATINLTARDGIALAQKCQGVTIDGCTIENTYSAAIDTEPVDQPVQNVTINNNRLSCWWNAANPARSGNTVLTIVGGKAVAPNEGNYARNYRVTNNKMRGAVAIADAADIVVAHNRIVCDWDGYSYSPITVTAECEDIRILDNYVYDRCTEDPSAGGRIHTSAIAVQAYTSGATNLQPAGVRIAGNRIYTRNGRHGIKVEGTGALADGSGAVLAGVALTPDTVSDDSVFKGGAGWAQNQWQGYRFRIGAAWATVESNTEEDLTLWVENSYTSAWRSPTGEEIATPPVAAGVFWLPNAYVTVDNNYIDCTDDGYGAGGFGIFIYTFRAGMRVKVRGNEIKNAVTDGINIDFEDSARPIISLELADNFAWDDQITPTCTSAVRFVPTVRVTKLIMRNNQAGDGVATVTSGLSSGTWLVNDGMSAEWTGYGSPESVVSAPIGSRFIRLDGSASTTLYVKTSGTGSTGWTAK